MSLTGALLRLIHLLDSNSDFKITDKQMTDDPASGLYQFLALDR